MATFDVAWWDESVSPLTNRARGWRTVGGAETLEEARACAHRVLKKKKRLPSLSILQAVPARERLCVEVVFRRWPRWWPF